MQNFFILDSFDYIVFLQIDIGNLSIYFLIILYWPYWKNHSQ